MHRTFAYTVVVGMLLAASSGVALAASAGQKKADKLISAAQQTTSAIRATNLQVKKTLESYNYIVEGKASDVRAEYKKLNKDLKKSQQAREDVRYKAEAMQKAADAYWTEWEASLAGFNSEEMRAKSEARLAETQENYGKIFEAGSVAADEFDAFISKMEDQIRFLGVDLNPSAIADLADEAAELNGQADAFFESITQTLKTAVDYTESLEPQ